MNGPEQDTGKGTKAGSAGPAVGSPVDGSDPFGMAEWLKDMPKVQLHPLMQHPAAAMAAATAIGLGVTSHIAGFMFGAMQGMSGTAQKTGAPAEEAAAVAEVEPVASAVKAAEPVPVEETAQAVRTAPVKAAAVKPEPAKSVRAKAAPVATVPAAAEKPRRKQPAARVVETQADDLKRISGIGPKLEQVLNGMGVRRYADVASWSDKDVQRYDAQLGFGGRIARDGWVEQAKALMKG